MPVIQQKTTYVSLPPPPLPEFYASRAERKEASTASTSTTTSEDESEREILETTKELLISVDGTYDYEPRDTRPAHPPQVPFVVMPPLPRMDYSGPPPLAIYHICRICLRPRSARYHREHPIPLDNIPPPPGICRRCRVTTGEDSKNMELVYESKSNPIKLGFFTPFMRDEDIVSQEEMRKVKVDQHLRGRSINKLTVQRRDSAQEKSRPRDHGTSRGRSETQRDIEYRHIKVGDKRSREDEIADVTVERGNMVYSSSQEAMEAYNEPSPATAISKSKTRRTSTRVEPTEQLVSERAPSARYSETHIAVNTKPAPAPQSSSLSYHSASSSTSTSRALPEGTAPSLGIIESEIRRIARDQVDQHVKTIQAPERSDSQIRRIANEEVERYRATERKMDAHHEAFAHGRLVPVERRIEIERDAPADMSWSSAANEDATKVAKSAKGNTQRPSTSWSEPKQVEVDVSVRSRMSIRKAEAEAPPAPSSVESVKSQAKQSSVQISEKGQTQGWYEEASWGFEDAKTATIKGSEKASSRAKQLSPIAEQDDGTPSKGSWAIHKRNASEHCSWGPRWQRELSVERRRSEVETERSGRQQAGSTRGFETSTQLTDGEPPSVKLRESYDEAKGSGPPQRCSKAESNIERTYRTPRTILRGVVDGNGEANIPPKPRASSYRRSEEEGQRVSRSDRHGSSYEREVAVSYVHYRERNRPANSIQKPPQEPADETPSTRQSQTSEFQREKDTIRAVEIMSSRRNEDARNNEDVAPSSPPRKSAKTRQSKTQSDKTRWVQDEDAQAGFNEDTRSIGSRAQMSRVNPYPAQDLNLDYDSTPSPQPKDNRRYGTSRRSERGRDSDVEYIYTERIVTPADKPRGWRPKHLQTLEEEVHYRRGDDQRRASPQ